MLDEAAAASLIVSTHQQSLPVDDTDDNTSSSDAGQLLLASGDREGNVYVVNVKSGHTTPLPWWSTTHSLSWENEQQQQQQSKASSSNNNNNFSRSVSGLEWHPNNYCGHLLLVLYTSAPNSPSSSSSSPSVHQQPDASHLYSNTKVTNYSASNSTSSGAGSKQQHSNSSSGSRSWWWCNAQHLNNNPNQLIVWDVATATKVHIPVTLMTERGGRERGGGEGEREKCERDFGLGWCCRLCDVDVVVCVICCVAFVLCCDCCTRFASNTV